jgi:hypothetical protein
VNLFLDVVLGLALFVIFERKRFPAWRNKYLAMRSKSLQARAGRTLAAALADAGFFDGVSPEESQRVRTAIETNGYGGVFDHPWRVLDADDEELAEGSVGVYLHLWAPSLERLGVAPLVGESRFVDGGAHILDLPNETVTLVSNAEAQEDEKGKKFGFSWGAVGARLMQRVNTDLAAAGVADRLYSVYGGNDARALLLTPPMLAAIMATPGVRRDELPYTRTAEWPHFGMDNSPTLS